jgi:hypothetical protein
MFPTLTGNIGNNNARKRENTGKFNDKFLFPNT